MDRMKNHFFPTVTTGQPISCCNPDGSWPLPRYIHPHCAAIRIPEQDPIYGNHSISCMNYVRSLPVIEQDCNFGPIEQVQKTAVSQIISRKRFF